MAKKILLLDDSLTARRLIVSFLNHLPVLVLEAQDGIHGLEILNQNKDISLIFSDINMPHMNGLEFVEKLRSDVLWANHIPICMITTETGDTALQKAKTLGVNAFLVKPVQKDQLLAVVNGYLV
jgi:two-component system chemotaxis response regulator CheY